MSPVFEKHRGKGLVTPPRASMSVWLAGFLALAAVALIMLVLIAADATSRHCLQIGYGINACDSVSPPPAEAP